MKLLTQHDRPLSVLLVHKSGLIICESLIVTPFDSECAARRVNLSKSITLPDPSSHVYLVLNSPIHFLCFYVSVKRWVQVGIAMQQEMHRVTLLQKNFGWENDLGCSNYSQFSDWLSIPGIRRTRGHKTRLSFNFRIKLTCKRLLMKKKNVSLWLKNLKTRHMFNCYLCPYLYYRLKWGQILGVQML